MKYLNLETFTDFVCTGSDCPFTCCGGGWKIYIDKATDDYYRTVTGEMGKRLAECIRRENGYSSFILDENGNCPFLNDRGLCDIYINLGEEHLSDTCRYYPRYGFKSGDTVFSGVSISCPVVSRFFMTHEQPLEIDFSEDEPAGSEEMDIDWELFNHSVRAFTAMVEIAQNRDLSISERLALILILGDRFQLCVDEKRDPDSIISLFTDPSVYTQLLSETGIYDRDYISKLHFCSSMLSFFGNLNHLEKHLPEIKHLLDHFSDPENHEISTAVLEDAFSRIDGQEHMIWRENTLVYVLFRYFMEGFEKRDFYEKLMIGVGIIINVNTCTLILEYIQSGSFASLDHRIDLMAHLSRTIEHSSNIGSEAIRSFRDSGFFDLPFLLRFIS